MTTSQTPQTRVISPRSFPHDPRHEQTRTPLHTIYPHHRIFSKCAKRGESPLLRLPEEILAQITRCLAGIDQGHHLPSFALAHSECRQLARPFQFADVWIMDGEVSRKFLRFLLHEDWDGEGLVSIGSCVRSLAFTFKSDFTHFIHHGPEFEGYDEAAEKWYEYWQGVLAGLAEVIKHKLPMLERVHWQHLEDELYYIDPPDDTSWIDLMPVILEKTTSSGRVRTLYLEDDNLNINGDGRAESLLPGNAPLRLTDLAIGYSRCRSETRTTPETDYLYETILRRSAQSVESLALNPTRYVVDDPDELSGEIRFRDGSLHFPKLRKFWSFSHPHQRLHHTVVESFLSGPLESFAPSPNFCRVMRREGMIEKSPLPYLRTWAVTRLDVEPYAMRDALHIDECLAVAQAYGERLEHLFIYVLDAVTGRGGGSDDGAEAKIPSHIASGKFSNLRSLCFVKIREPDLTIFKVIGANLQTLEELSFGLPLAGDMTNNIEEAIHIPVDHLEELPGHATLQKALAPLRNLERLGIFGDEYVADFAGPRWAWHRFIKEYVWYQQGRSSIWRETGNMPFTGQPWSEGERGHKRPGDGVPDEMTPMLVGEDDSKPLTSSELRQAACKLGDEYAAALPNLQEFMIGRLLLQVRPSTSVPEQRDVADEE